MIEDPELRRLFEAESEEHIHALESGLVALEAGSAREGLANELLREAHSLKGAARMLGLEEIETIMHAMEDALRAAAHTAPARPGQSLQALFDALDQIRQLVREALTGKHAAIDLRRILERLRQGGDDAGAGGTPAGDAAAHRPRPEAVAAAPARAPSDPAARPPASAVPPPTDIPPDNGPPPPMPQGAGSPSPAADEPHPLETIRVATHRLDDLMAQAGELVVAHQRLVSSTADAGRLGALLEALRRSLAEEGAGDNRSHRAGRRSSSAILHDCLELAARVEERLQEDGRRLDSLVGALAENVREARLLPVATLFNLFPRSVRDIAQAENKAVRLEVRGADTTADKHVIEVLKDPLMHLLRNAIHHGVEPAAERETAGKDPTATLSLAARREGGEVVISVADDGRGLDLDAVRRAAADRGHATMAELAAMDPGEVADLVFRPGFSTATEVSGISGRGVGLDVARTALEEIKGHITLSSEPGAGTTVELRLPVTLTTTRILLVRAGEVPLGVPMDGVRVLRRVTGSDVYLVEGRPTLDVDGHGLSALELAQVLGLGTAVPPTRDARRLCVVLSHEGARAALLVDDVLGEQEVLLKPLGGVLQRVTHLLGTTILSNGEVCMVLNPRDLIHAGGWDAPRPAPTADPAGKVLLVAEDSMVTRVQLKRILEGAGYRVVTAVDGLDALERLEHQPVDGLVSDINMPQLDGVALTERLRASPRFRHLPVILVTTLQTDEDRRRGLEAGANAYLTKSAFAPDLLLTTLERLL